MGIIDDYFDGYYTEEMIESKVIHYCIFYSGEEVYFMY